MDSKSSHSSNIIGVVTFCMLIAFWLGATAFGTYWLFQQVALEKGIAETFAETQNYISNVIQDASDTVGLLDTNDIPLGVEITDQQRASMQDAVAYQAGAFSLEGDTFGEYPAVQTTLPNVTPQNLPEGYTGSIWIGLTLDNATFLQLGMITDNQTKPGNTQWNVFWQNWSGNVYTSGYQSPLSEVEGVELDNQFSITCRNPELGEWEFWMNETIIGKTYTENCDASTVNSQVFWELTASQTNEEISLPEFGPFELSGPEFWNDFEWQVVDDGIASYSYGKVFEGTQVSDSAVCPPFGLQAISDSTRFLAGSSVACAPLYSFLW